MMPGPGNCAYPSFCARRCCECVSVMQRMPQGRAKRGLSAIARLTPRMNPTTQSHTFSGTRDFIRRSGERLARPVHYSYFARVNAIENPGCWERQTGLAIAEVFAKPPIVAERGERLSATWVVVLRDPPAHHFDKPVRDPIESTYFGPSPRDPTSDASPQAKRISPPLMSGLADSARATSGFRI